MVASKNFFLATSLLLGWVAAAPTPELNVIEKRALFKGDDANNVCENQFVTPQQISDNGGSATVVDLTGCTAAFFFKGNTLQRAYHIFCGNEKTDGETAGEVSSDSDYVQIVAADANHFNDARDGIKAGNADIEIGALKTYDADNLAAGKAIAVKGATGSHALTESTVDRVCTQPGEVS